MTLPLDLRYVVNDDIIVVTVNNVILLYEQTVAIINDHIAGTGDYGIAFFLLLLSLPAVTHIFHSTVQD